VEKRRQKLTNSDDALHTLHNNLSSVPVIAAK